MYEPVELEDIDLNETYCIWVSDNDHEEIHPDDLEHYKMTGELYHNGYEIPSKAKTPIFKKPVYVNPKPKENYLKKLFDLYESMREEDPYTYLELACTRQTDYMVWITDKPLETHPDRKILYCGQGTTPEEACKNAFKNKDGECD